jgi:hypothetical protein
VNGEAWHRLLPLFCGYAASGGSFAIGVGPPVDRGSPRTDVRLTTGRGIRVGLSLRLLRLLRGVMRRFGHSLPFARELQPRLAVFLAQGASRLVAALLGLF